MAQAITEKVRGPQDDAEKTKYCFVLSTVCDCLHSCCRLKRGEMTKEEYLHGVARWHFDENWGRFLEEGRRAYYHNLLVKDALERNLTDKEELPTIDILAAVSAGVFGDEAQ